MLVAVGPDAISATRVGANVVDAAYVGSNQVYSAGPPMDAGETLLRTIVGWWDPTDYVGSGALINKGMGGSALDATVVGPTTAGGKMTFDGVNDYCAIPNHALLNFDGNGDWHIGIICELPGPRNSYGALVSKFDGSNGYVLYNHGTAADGAWIVQGAGAFTTATGFPSTAKNLYSLQRDNAAELIRYFDRDVLNGTAADAGHITAANAAEFNIGAQINHSGQFPRMDVYCVFLARRKLTTGELDAIATHYGLVI